MFHLKEQSKATRVCLFLKGVISGSLKRKECFLGELSKQVLKKIIRYKPLASCLENFGINLYIIFKFSISQIQILEMTLNIQRPKPQY